MAKDPNKRKTRAMNSSNLLVTGWGSLGVLGFIYALFVFIVHVIMALAVNGDSKRLVSSGSGLFLLGPFLWGWLVFIFGLAGFALYWAIHHSSLRDVKPPQVR